MTEKQREDAAEYRRLRRFPKHSPPHFDSEMPVQYILSAACFEHAHIVGQSAKRMTDFEADILAICENSCSNIFAWCILPNHYHLLLKTDKMKALRKEIGLFHGRMSFGWNGEEDARGRQVWHNCFERKIRSERHFYASLNYVLNNAVHHGYAENWNDWQWSNARQYLDEVGREHALKVWKEYPVLNYGKTWDNF